MENRWQWRRKCSLSSAPFPHRHIGSIQLKLCRNLYSRSSLNPRRNLVNNLQPGMSDRWYSDYFLPKGLPKRGDNTSYLFAYVKVTKRITRKALTTYLPHIRTLPDHRKTHLFEKLKANVSKISGRDRQNVIWSKLTLTFCSSNFRASLGGFLVNSRKSWSCQKTLGKKQNWCKIRSANFRNIPSKFL